MSATIYTVRLTSWTDQQPAVYAARRAGARLLNITVGSGGSEGAPFAPSAAIKDEALDARKFAQRLRARDPHKADRVEASAWATYREAFAAEMAISQLTFPDAWARLGRGGPVALGCYCGEWTMGTRVKVLHCHRVLVAEILAGRGCRLGGEIAT